MSTQASDSYLQLLNPSQREAVEHGEGPLLVFAGAGSGKTRVLTFRVLHLIIQGLAKPEQILAVTFTNKAAREMKERVAKLLDRNDCAVWVSTFHASCARILRLHADALGFSRNFAIYDRSESLAAMKRVMKQLRIDPRVITASSALSSIDKAKNHYLDPESLRELESQNPYWDEHLYHLYKAYQEELLRANAMDFGDLLCHTLALLELSPAIRRRYQQLFKFILVDEYQDTNKVQYLLIKLLAEQHQNLCVVGDDDQSIYAFRGATIENILNFKNDFPEAKSVTLEINYRSTKNILSAANAVIARNARRAKKSLVTDNPVGELISCYCADDERDEAYFVATELRKCIRENIPLSDIAIFYRTNAQSRAFEDCLADAGIPFRIFGGLRFYDRKEIKDILSYLRVLLNPADNESFLRVINNPPRGIGASTIEKLNHLATPKGISLWDATLVALRDGTLGAATGKKLQSFYDIIEQLRAELQQTEVALQDANAPSDTLSRLLRSIAEKSGYLQALINEDTEESTARLENLQELFVVAEEFIRAARREGFAADLLQFLDRTSLVSDLDAENTKSSTDAEPLELTQGAVSMMTLHLAKGLEFRVAFLVGMEDGLLPHVRSLDSRAALEEERRLCYVGITRGKEKLYLTRCATRGSGNRGNGWSSGLASRFLADIPQEVLDDRGGFIEFSYGNLY